MAYKQILGRGNSPKTGHGLPSALKQIFGGVDPSKKGIHKDGDKGYVPNAYEPSTEILTSKGEKVSRLYRQDMWRPSHLKTMKGFLWKAIDKEDFKDKGEFIRFADDLVMMFAALEMTPANKVGHMNEVCYVYNASSENQVRTISDATNQANRETEIKIRNRKPYELYKHKS